MNRMYTTRYGQLIQTTIRYLLPAILNTILPSRSTLALTKSRFSSAGERLDVLVTLVEAYESKHYPLDLPDPVEAIRFRMEQKGMTPRDLVPMIGRINRVYEVLGRRRALTLAMIQRLHRELGIPAESLIKQSERRKAA